MNSALHRGLDSSFDGIRRTEKLLKSSSSNKLMPVGLPSEKKILDPQGPFLQSWNKIFVLSCVISVSLDPLFFYVPVIDNRKMCLRLDGKVEAVVCILRFFKDLFYVVHIVFSVSYRIYWSLFPSIWKRCFSRRFLDNSNEVSVIILSN